MKQGIKMIILIIFSLANSWGVSQVSANCENQANASVISVEFTQEKEFLFLNLRAKSINPIFSCEFSLKYDNKLLEFVEYQTEQDWLTNVWGEKDKLKILQSRFRQYTYWIAEKQIFLGALKFKILKKTPLTEFVIENLIIIELEQFINPKTNTLCRSKKIKIMF